MRLAILIICACIMLSFSIAQAKIINIPADYPTIQEGIFYATEGDVVLVAPGTYEENIYFYGKGIAVRSSEGPEVTVIDGGNPVNPQRGSVVMFMADEGRDSVLNGFKLINGTGCAYEYYPNTWTYGGGGIFCTKASPTIINNIITENSIETNGAGIYLFDNCSPIIVNNIISNNTAEETGGGISCTGDSSAVITNNAVLDNISDYKGGGIFVNSSRPVITNNIISGNSTYYEGGGISCRSYKYPAAIANNIISGNSSDFDGGGIFCWQSCSPPITNNLIMGNTTNRGGGIGCDTSSHPEIRNNIILENIAHKHGYSDGKGGGIYCEWSSRPTIMNNTFVRNTAQYEGGGICSDISSAPTVINTILWDNTAEYGPEIGVDGISGHYSTIHISYSNVKGGISSVHIEPECTINWGDGMIDADPLLVDLINNDFHLTYPSPCRNTGDNTYVVERFDFEGDPRFAWDGIVDMGADEFYTHLYITGDQAPGGDIRGKLVGLPDTSPVYLIVSVEAWETPLPTWYGDMYLVPPRVWFPLVPIPSNGILELSAAIPMTPPAPYDIPMQGLVGLNSDSLTNLCVLEVR